MVFKRQLKLFTWAIAAVLTIADSTYARDDRSSGRTVDGGVAREIASGSLQFGARAPKSVDVVVVGAGLSGLAAAYELKKKGLSYHVLEIAPRIGGRVKTAKYEFDGENLVADSGMEEYWESNPAVKMLKELRLPVRHDAAASSLMLDKKLYSFEQDEDSEKFLKKIFSKEEFAALESFKKKLEPMVEVLRNKQRAVEPIPSELLALKDKSFADWVGSQKLSKRVAEWIRVSIECEIGTVWSNISAVDGISEFHIFLGQGEESYRVVGGNEKFVTALAQAIGPQHISVNDRVHRFQTMMVDGKASGVTVFYQDQATNAQYQVQAKHVISTIPLYRLFELQFEPAISAKKMQAVQSQSWGSYFKAHLIVSRAAEKFWTKNGSSLLPILSDSELGVIYDGNPDQTSTKNKIISLLITGPMAEAFNMMPQDQVRAQIFAGLDRLWPGFTKEVKQTEFYRVHPRAIAAWPVGRSRFDDLSNEIRRPENRVYFAGDFTESSHSDGAFLSAYRAVRQILEAEKTTSVVGPSPTRGLGSAH